MWTTAEEGGVRQKQDVHKRKIFSSNTQNNLRFEDTPHTRARMTVSRNTYDPDVRDREGGRGEECLHNGRSWTRGETGVLKVSFWSDVFDG